MTVKTPKFGPSGQVVFDRTYSRPLPNGEKEDWYQTVERVVVGNLSLVYGAPEEWSAEVLREAERLREHIEEFKLLPAGRHLWASGVKGRQFLMNCWTAGWTEKLSDHFEFTFMRLMEGGGVGANYSSHFLKQYGVPRRELKVHVVCSEDHADYEAMREQGLLSSEYVADWAGSFEVADSREGWAAALVDLIDTFMTDDEVKHADRVYDVSNVRPEGARLKTFGGTASGPAPFARMLHEVARVLNNAQTEIYSQDQDPVQQITPLEAMEIDHAIAECVVSGGVRRSARMSIVRWDDPFIFDFIHCKEDTGKHWTTNISVEIDDKFIELLNADDDGITFNYAKGVHAAVVAAALHNGEPGYWNSSLSNHGEVEPVFATNPCGEITLQMFEACNLGHVNLNAFAPTKTAESWDEGGLSQAHRLMTRFLIRATFGDISDPKSREIQDRNRRIGVGHLGVQDFIVKNGWKYSEVASEYKTQGYHYFRSLLDRMYQTVRSSARDYAFELRIPEPVKVTTVAPTGSVAKLAGVGEGIHPRYARYFERRIRFSLVDPEQKSTVFWAERDGFKAEIDQYDKSGNTAVVVYPTKDTLVEQVEALGYDGSIVEQADEIDLDSMLAFQQMYQKHYADNAVSFTVNIDPEKVTEEQLSKSLRYRLAGLKGTTIMPDGSRPQAPYTRITQEQYEAAEAKRIEDSVDEDCSTGACPIR